MARGPDNAMGTWEGEKFCLREFPATPSSGSSKGVNYTQTLGKMTLKYVFHGPIAELTAKDLVVELSSWCLAVTVEGREDLAESLKPINGDFYGDVRRQLSWWTLEEEYDAEEAGRKVFTVELAKKDNKAWNGIWKLGMNSQRRQYFAPATRQKAPVKKAEEFLVKVKASKPACAAQDLFVMGREALCTGLEHGQDETQAVIRIHLDKAALEKAFEKVSLGSIFAVDVTERFIKIFIRGDENSPICMGELGGSCIPAQTVWEIVKAAALKDGEPEPQQSSRARPPKTEYNSALQVRIVKALDSRRLWPVVVSENSYALERGAAPSALEDYTVKREPSPDRAGWAPQDHARENKGKADAAFKKNSWRNASVYYTRAINHTPEDEKLYSNRSACYMKMQKFDKALNDARKGISLNQHWPKAYFRQGQALRGLQKWEDAKNAFIEGRFRDCENPEWDKEMEKTEEEQSKYENFCRDERRRRREADMTTELNEATVVAEREALVSVAEAAMNAGKDRKEAAEMAVKGAELAKQRVHEMANQRKKAMMVEDDMEPDVAAPYRIVREDGAIHPKGFAHTDKGQYFMGMVMMNFNQAPVSQPWIEIWHPCKLRWSQGSALIQMKVTLPDSVKTAAEIKVVCTTTSIQIGTYGDSDVIIEGEFERKVEPEGENFSWYLVPDEVPPLLELCIDKDTSETYQTYSYGTLIWPRLFTDDVILGEGLFEADLTDLPPHLQDKFKRDNARTASQSLDERTRRKLMTEEEISEETCRNWNDEFARHGMPYRLDSNEDKMLESFRA